MIGVILAAGMAKRLRPLTDERPKCLLKVGQRTLLQRTVDAVVEAGIDELVVVTGYRNNMIVDFLKANYPALNVHFIDNPDYAHNNNIFSLWLTRPYTEGKDFLLLDSDILFDPAIIPTIVRQEGSVLALNRHELGEEEIKVIVDSEGYVKEISKICSIQEAIGESVGIEKMGGHKVCDCAGRCACPRFFSQPDCDIGWDSSRNLYFPNQWSKTTAFQAVITFSSFFPVFLNCSGI